MPSILRVIKTVHYYKKKLVKTCIIDYIIIYNTKKFVKSRKYRYIIYTAIDIALAQNSDKLVMVLIIKN